MLEETTKDLSKLSFGGISGSNTGHRCTGMDKGVLGSNVAAWNFTEEEKTMKKVGTSLVLVDAKALFDAVLSLAPGLQLSEKRTAIEVA